MYAEIAGLFAGILPVVLAVAVIRWLDRGPAPKTETPNKCGCGQEIPAGDDLCESCWRKFGAPPLFDTEEEAHAYAESVHAAQAPKPVRPQTVTTLPPVREVDPSVPCFRCGAPAQRGRKLCPQHVAEKLARKAAKAASQAGTESGLVQPLGTDGTAGVWYDRPKNGRKPKRKGKEGCANPTVPSTRPGQAPTATEPRKGWFENSPRKGWFTSSPHAVIPPYEAPLPEAVTPGLGMETTAQPGEEASAHFAQDPVPSRTELRERKLATEKAVKAPKGPRAPRRRAIVDRADAAIVARAMERAQIAKALGVSVDEIEEMLRVLNEGGEKPNLVG